MVSLYRLKYPYIAPDDCTAADVGDLQAGELLVVRPIHTASIESIEQALGDVQARLPCATICLWVDLLPETVAMEAALLAGERGVPGLITRPIIDAKRLRAQITAKSRMPRDMAHRLELLGYTTSVDTVRLLEVVVSRTAECRTLARALALSRVKYSKLRRNMVRPVGLKPADLYQAARLVAVIGELQSDQDSSVFDVAIRNGYWDDAALRARLRNIFGVTPATVRKWIGWEALFCAALSVRQALPS